MGEQQRHAARAAGQFAQKPRLSDEELATLERRAQSLFGPEADAIFGDAFYFSLLANKPPAGLGATGTYSQDWLPDRYFEHRTSLITDPPDGKLPPLTPAGSRLRASRRAFGANADSVQQMSMQDRCIHYGFPDLFAGYMSVYRITQSQPGLRSVFACDSWFLLDTSECGADESLRRAVDAMLEAHDEAGDFGRTAAFLAGLAGEPDDEADAVRLTGTRFGRYAIGAILGAGGMGRSIAQPIRDCTATWPSRCCCRRWRRIPTV